mgnify:CR=1 FL=1
MKYTVDGWNNFCKVFEIPNCFPSGFCFNEWKSVSFKMVDWFNPVPGLPNPVMIKEQWIKKIGKYQEKEVDLDELKEDLKPFILGKPYIKPGRSYLVLFDFGASIIIINKESKN